MSVKPAFSMIPIEKTAVYHEVFLRLNQLIDTQMRPGDRLPSERELSTQLGVSRTTVRQGIKVLESMGKVETRVGSGTFVTVENILLKFGCPEAAIDADFLRSLCIAREGIEKTIFREFFDDHCSGRNLRRIETLLSSQERELQAQENSPGVDVVYEFEFERLVAALTGNAITSHMQEEIHKLWAYAWSRVRRVPEKRLVLHSEHKIMLQAMRQGDWEALSRNISEHVNKNIDAIELFSDGDEDV